MERAVQRVEQAMRSQWEQQARTFNEQYLQERNELFARVSASIAVKHPEEMMSSVNSEEWAYLSARLSEVEKALEKLPPELQGAFWDTPIDDGFFELVALVFNPSLTDEQRTAELASFFAEGAVESSWLQLRRVLYPVVKGRSGILATIFSTLAMVAVSKESEVAFYYFITWAFIFFAIDVEGAPDERKSQARKSK